MYQTYLDPSPDRRPVWVESPYCVRLEKLSTLVGEKERKAQFVVPQAIQSWIWNKLAGYGQTTFYYGYT